MSAFGWVSTACLAALLASPLWAAGGTHIVDDYGVETPGVCNSELFGKHFARSVNQLAATVNCTTRALPAIEWGFFFTHLAYRGSGETLLGPGIKVKLRDPVGGPGLAIAGSFKLGVQTGRLEVATLALPATFTLSDRVNLSINLSWIHTRLANQRYTGKVGAQVEAAVFEQVSLMGEAFVALDGVAGGQAGLRWTPGAGAVDFDLTLGRRIDGASALSIASGLIIRF